MQEDGQQLGGGNGHEDLELKSTNQSKARRPTALVLGMGFGGLWAARTLASGGVNVVVVDRHNFHTFFPLLYQVGAAELEPEEIAHPLRKILWKTPNVKIHLADVLDVDFASKRVKITGQELSYDYLVIGLGSQPNTYGIPGVEENAFTLKSLDQGMVLRNHILRSFERASCEKDPEARRRWLTFTIVGGGPTGVEFAGALIELVRGSIRKDFPDLDMREVQIILVEALDHLLEGMPRELGDYARRRLTQMGVDVRTGAQVTQITPLDVSLKGGVEIPSGTAVWTAGVKGNALLNQWGLPVDRHNQVQVLPTLQSPDHPEVYVIGDLAHIMQDGHPLPMVAQVGIQTGTAAARNILAQIAHQPLKDFHYRDKGTLAVIGRNSAAAYIAGRSFTGFPAWLLWLGIHITYLIGFRNRLLVLIDWAWSYFFFEHGVRLIVPSEPVPEKMGEKV
jgi:NADH dehydrogenase